MGEDKARFFRAVDTRRKPPPDADRLRDWAGRIRHWLAASNKATRYEGMIFRPSVNEADALVRLEGRQRFAAGEIAAALEETEKRFKAFREFPSDRLGDALHEAMEEQAERILAVAANVAVPDKPDTIPDTPRTKLPDSVDVRDLCRALQKGLPQGRTQIEIAREFVGEDGPKADNLLRQARRYRHLWKR